jgi:hypothetical protein
MSIQALQGKRFQTIQIMLRLPVTPILRSAASSTIDPRGSRARLHTDDLFRHHIPSSPEEKAVGACHS